MKKDEILKTIEAAGDADFILRTSTEEETFLENYKASILETEVGAKSQLFAGLEDDIFRVTGVKKQQGDQLHKYLTSQLVSLKAKAEKVKVLEEEVETLKKDKPDDAKLQEIKDLQKQITKIKADHDNEITNLAKQNLKSSVRSEIERGLLGLKIKAGIPESMKQIYIDNIISELSENAEIREGKIVFLDKDGKAQRDPSTMAPFTAEAILKDRMRDVIDTGRKIEGPGMVEKVERKDGKLSIVLPSDVTSREKLGEHLVSLGVKRNTKEYMDAYAEFGKDLPAFEKK